MLHCLSLNTSSTNSAAPPPSDFHSQGNSPTVNLSREYALTVHTNSYNEMWSIIHPTTSEEQLQVQEYNGEIHHHHHHLLLAEVLHPNRECVEEALRHAKSNSLTALVKDYFNHSENAANLCLLFHRSVINARSLYAPLHALFQVHPLESSLSQSQCDHVFNLLLEFDSLDNPFPSTDSYSFDEMRQCFSQLKQQLDRCLHKSRSRIRLIRCATTSSAVCFICTAVGVAVSAVALASHALVPLVAGTLCCTACLPQKCNKKEVAHIAQLDAAAMGTYKLDKELDTIDRLVARLRNAVDNDKSLIRLGLERGNEKHAIQVVMKRLQSDHPNFLHLLKDLEEHICLCFITINKARALLLQEIILHQSCDP
uniref:Uncharacterized protein n=1 Tax=Fagus sylvatica TaxID=28930 RepID=A0A2N9J760_FAGSY